MASNFDHFAASFSDHFASLLNELRPILSQPGSRCFVFRFSLADSLTVARLAYRFAYQLHLRTAIN